MALRVNTNVEAIQIHGQLVKTQLAVSDSLKKLSTGKRINSAKDDAAGFIVANKFRSDSSSMRVAYQNASEAQSMLNVADGAYTKIHDILVRMKDLATQAASGQTNQAPLQSEFALLQSEIDRIANSTKYNTTTLISGDYATAGITFQIGQTNGSNYQMSLTLKGAKTSDLSVGSSTTGIGSLASAQIAMGTIDTALTSINDYMGTVGGTQNRLAYTMDNISITIENYTASESAIRDVDMAYEVMSFSKNQILQQSGMAMLAQANSAPQAILSLLGGR